jgi:hypothetical protein
VSIVVRRRQGTAVDIVHDGPAFSPRRTGLDGGKVSCAPGESSGARLQWVLVAT